MQNYREYATRCGGGGEGIVERVACIRRERGWKRGRGRKSIVSSVKRVLASAAATAAVARRGWNSR